MSWNVCPICGAKAGVVDTRPAKGSVKYIRRRYRCVRNHRYSTSEVLIPRSRSGRETHPGQPALGLAKAQARLDRLREVLGQLREGLENAP